MRRTVIVVLLNGAEPQDVLQTMNIDIKKCVGNSTDGAANMQGQYKGFDKYLKDASPEQIHVWCYAHVLNLVMLETTTKTIPAINLFGLINKCAVFVRDSYKRMIVWKKISEDTKFVNLIGDTRWWAKDKALVKIFNNETGIYVNLCEALHCISTDENFNAETRFTAKSYLDNFLKYETILTAILFLKIFRLESTVLVSTNKRYGLFTKLSDGRKYTFKT